MTTKKSSPEYLPYTHQYTLQNKCMVEIVVYVYLDNGQSELKSLIGRIQVHYFSYEPLIYMLEQ